MSATPSHYRPYVAVKRSRNQRGRRTDHRANTEQKQRVAPKLTRVGMAECVRITFDTRVPITASQERVLDRFVTCLGD